MAAPPIPSSLRHIVLFLFFIQGIIPSSSQYTSLFSFGDSATAAGVQTKDLAPGEVAPHCAFPPYGETYFNKPTGRCSDGRLIVDFLAQQLRLPLLPSYYGDPITNITSLARGANFAVVSGTALDFDFLKARGVQLRWFKSLMKSVCSSECKGYLKKSLILLGEIGGVDYQRASYQGFASDKVEELIPLVVKRIGSAIEELIELGAVNFIVPGDFPKGCFPSYLTRFLSSNHSDYDPITGCLVYYNWFSDHHNRMLRKEISRVQELHPSVRIRYGDYYGSAIRMHENPDEFGLKREDVNRACCGAGGPYNYNPSAVCGRPGAIACDSPSTYVKWDDHHYTEAANRIIAGDVFRLDSAPIAGETKKPYRSIPYRRNNGFPGNVFFFDKCCLIL
ncbi:GDSL esterase/lipase At1g28580 [Linum perenne]